MLVTLGPEDKSWGSIIQTTVVTIHSQSQIQNKQNKPNDRCPFLKSAINRLKTTDSRTVSSVKKTGNGESSRIERKRGGGGRGRREAGSKGRGGKEGGWGKKETENW